MEDENRNDEPESRLAEPPEGFWEAVEEPEVSPETQAREAIQEQLQEAGQKRRRALVNVNVSRNKGIVAQMGLLTGQVARLANAVERLLAEAYDVRMQPGDMGGEEPQVDFTDQDKYDINEALEQAKNLEDEGDHH